MSRNHNPFAFDRPITLGNLHELFAHHKTLTGGFSMTAGNPAPEPEPPAGGDNPPERPDDVTEEEWGALGDPGKQALMRERTRRETAERNLAVARARPAPPKPAAPPAPAGGQQDPPKPKDGDQPDIAALIKQAVDAAVKPFTDREEQRTVDEAADKVRTAVLDAAKGVLHDATDALTQVDLTTVIDDNGVADPVKVKSALTDLVTRKPHLAKPGQQQRQAPPGIGGGAPANATEGEKVAAALARMQKSVNLRPPTQQTS